MPNPFDDLLPDVAGATPAANPFDDLIPTGPEESSNPFDDLVPDAEPGWLRSGLAFAARTLPPIAAGGAGFALGGPPGAIAGGAVGGALGETIAQQIESPASPTQWLPVAGEAALGAVPLGRAASTLGRVAERFGPKATSIAGGAIEGGLFGAGATAVQTATREGRAPTPGELALGAAGGGAIGGALGRARFRPEAASTDAAGAVSGAGGRIVPEAGDDAVGAARAADVAAREAARRARGVIEVLPAETIRQLSDAARNVPREALADNAALVGHLRSNRIIAELTERGRIRPVETPEGVTDLADMVRFASSNAGLTLQSITPLAELVDKLAGVQADAAKAAGNESLWRSLLNTRRALLVQQLGTQVRNAVTAPVRIGATATARLVTGIFDPQSRVMGFELARSLVQPIRAYRHSRELLEALPDFQKKVMQFGVGESEAENIAVRTARLLNLGMSKYSEKVPRMLALPAFARDAVTRAGLDYDAFKKAPQAFIDGLAPEARVAMDQALGEAAQGARAMTFANDPAGPVGKWLVKFVSDHPTVTLELPFPRFMASATDFLINYSPAGMLRLFATDPQASLAAGQRVMRGADPTFTARRVGEATVGTGMLAAALSLRMNPETTSEKSYELRIPGIDQPLDSRAYSPFLAPYLFLADALLRVDRGESLKKMPIAELSEGLLGLSRIEGLSSALIAPILGGGGGPTRDSIEGFAEQLEATLGEVLGSFTVPLRELKDIFGDQRSVDRQANQQMRVLGPTIANLPFAAEFLDTPQTIKPTTGKAWTDRRPVMVFGTPIRAGILKQLGISTIEKDRVERVIQQLGIQVGKPTEAYQIGGRVPVALDSQYRDEARPIARAMSQRVNQLMGPTVISAVGRYIETPGFAALRKRDPETARSILLDLIGDIRESARFQAEAELRVRSPRSATMLEAAAPASGPSGIARRRAYEGQLATRFGAAP